MDIYIAQPLSLLKQYANWKIERYRRGIFHLEIR